MTKKLFCIFCFSAFFSAALLAADQKTIYYPSGNIKDEFTVDDKGRPHGLYQTFYDKIDTKTGKQVQKGGANFRHGKLYGPLERFYPNGQKHLLANYENGKLHGRYVEYAGDGTTILEESVYDEGELKVDGSKKRPPTPNSLLR